jgi:TPP-dependent pyruvate/acetoin dehydrogenase alpha subunit
MGASLAKHLKVPSKFPKDMVSFVSLGDGSVNNAHFLSAVNLAEYAKFRSFKCPTVFCITDNNFSISLRGYDWLQKEFIHKLRMPVYKANGTNVSEIWRETQNALQYSRKTSSPCVLLLTNIPRRFGHAATDRQSAYMTKQEMEAVSNTNPLEFLVSYAVEQGVVSYAELAEEFQKIWGKVQNAFDVAVKEPKITKRSQVNERNNVPLVPLPQHAKVVPQNVQLYDNKPVSKQETVTTSTIPFSSSGADTSVTAAVNKVPEVMRKHMTKVFDETLQKYSNCVYIGEDVVNGGYYLVR